MSDPVANPESPASFQQDPSRRRFLKRGAALGAALVAGAGLPSRGERSRHPTIRRRSWAASCGPTANARALRRASGKGRRAVWTRSTILIARSAFSFVDIDDGPWLSYTTY